MGAREGNSQGHTLVPRPESGSLGRRLVAARAGLALCCLLAPIGGGAGAGGERTGTVGLEVVGDAIPRPLPGAAAGSAERGRALLVERGAANCLLCHAFPDPALRIAGNVGPSLAGVGGKFSAAQLRLRIVDIQKITPNAVMPSYYRVDDLDRVAREHRGKPILDGQQVEDLVAYLETLK